jgi:hypothetical protein
MDGGNAASGKAIYYVERGPFDILDDNAGHAGLLLDHGGARDAAL